MKVTFAGQADGLTARYQRWSAPLTGLLSQVALELAGRAGTRLARALGIAATDGDAGWLASARAGTVGQPQAVRLNGEQR